MSFTPTERMKNNFWISSLDSTEGIKKAEGTTAAYIRKILREEGFLRHIIPAEEVTEADCNRSVNHDTFVKIVDIEPDSHALTLTWRGEPTVNYIEGERAEVKFYTISSERFKKTEQELRAYEYPLKEVIKQNTIRDIEEKEDSGLIVAAESAIASTGKVIPSGGTTPQLFDKVTVRLGINLIDGDRLRARKILTNDVSFNEFVSQDHAEFGDQLIGQVTVDGYTAPTIMGRELITTNKTNIVPPGTTYYFTAPEFLGKFYVFGDVQFYIDKRANLISWQAWEDVGLALINIRSVSKTINY